jgi:SAM-dependent methyltransferase
MQRGEGKNGLAVSLRAHKEDWEDLAATDALWAILSNPEKKFGRWDVDDFFASGAGEIQRVMERATTLGYPVQHETALDFGCGVGRLTRALNAYFEHCHGVDISEAMVSRARELNAGHAGCTFTLNASERLSGFANRSVDMVYTNLVLQHVPSRHIIVSYIGEFARILKPGGLLVFQLPSHITLRRRIQWRRRMYRLLKRLGVSPRILHERLDLHPMRMSFMPEREVVSYLSSLGLHVLQIDRVATPEYASRTYYASQAEKTDP